ncbi:MAG: hypothetical protein WC543_06000 [Candidatus Omnitrophota bacterium]
MTSAPRYTHSFSLNKEDEDSLQKALKELPKGLGIIDIVKVGIENYKQLLKKK